MMAEAGSVADNLPTASGDVNYVVGTPEQVAQNLTPDQIRVATMAGQTPTVYVSAEWMAQYQEAAQQ